MVCMRVSAVLCICVSAQVLCVYVCVSTSAMCYVCVYVSTSAVCYMCYVCVCTSTMCYVLCVCQHKCEQYWPDSGEKKYGTVTVTMLSTRRTADYVIRTLQLAKVSVHVIAAAMTSERSLVAFL